MTLPSVQPSETRTTKMHATEQNPATTVETLLRSVAASCPVLSPREREVVAYIAAGFTHEQTARRTGLSRHTIDTYMKRIRAKLHVGNKAELTLVAMGLRPAA